MTTKREIIFLFQVALSFFILAFWQSPNFMAGVLFIVLILPFGMARKQFIRVWGRLGEILGKIVSPVVLLAVYFVVLTPLAILRKLFASNLLDLKRPSHSTLKAVPEESCDVRFEDLW